MSSPLRVHCLGARLVGGQIDRIEEGFRALGCEVVDKGDGADLVYANDAQHYLTALNLRHIVANPCGRVILNVLDLAPHLGAAFPLDTIKLRVGAADAVTTISSTVQRDIRARLGVEATVVYNPIRDVGGKVHALGLIPNPRALFVGRVNDPEKRAGVAASALAMLSFGWDDIATVGREQPHYGGVYRGEVTDDKLNVLYHAADFLMCPTRHAFLGLPILEAMACGTIPVVCNDLDILDEFLPADVFPEYREVEPTAPSIARFVARFMQDNDAKAEFSARVRAHYEAHWAAKLSPRGVAEAILKVYQGLA